LDIKNDEKPQVLVSANTIFGAEPLLKDSFSLVSCMVSPGFDFRDFIMFGEEELIKNYPEHSEIIKKLS
jgi:predicted cupin superfamily sugar epimerase